MLNAIIDASLRYKVLVMVAFAVLVGLGVMAYKQVPVDAFPDVTPAQVNIYTESPGVAAEDIERLLTVPIEAAMAGLARCSGTRLKMLTKNSARWICEPCMTGQFGLSCAQRRAWTT
jgi:cobalt-zinc-cadmium resistance protein CzcA